MRVCVVGLNHIYIIYQQNTQFVADDPVVCSLLDRGVRNKTTARKREENISKKK